MVARGMAETETDCGRSIDRGNNEIHGDFVIRVVDIGPSAGADGVSAG